MKKLLIFLILLLQSTLAYGYQIPDTNNTTTIIEYNLNNPYLTNNSFYNIQINGILDEDVQYNYYILEFSNSTDKLTIEYSIYEVYNYLLFKKYWVNSTLYLNNQYYQNNYSNKLVSVNQIGDIEYYNNIQLNNPFMISNLERNILSDYYAILQNSQNYNNLTITTSIKEPEIQMTTIDNNLEKLITNQQRVYASFNPLTKFFFIISEKFLYVFFILSAIPNNEYANFINFIYLPFSLFNTLIDSIFYLFKMIFLIGFLPSILLIQSIIVIYSFMTSKYKLFESFDKCIKISISIWNFILINPLLYIVNLVMKIVRG